MKTHSLFFLIVTLLFVQSPATLTAAPSKPEKDVDPQSLFSEGTALLLDLKFAEAEEKLRAAAEADSNLAEVHNNLAYVLRKQGKFEEALEHYNRAISLNAELPEPYMYRGVLHVQMDSLGAAHADLEILKALNPELAEELAFVIEQGQEKEPEQFFGVVRG
ncbi:MAG: tetratricopeptide repeat protein [Verrucomicrobiales bacterium]